MGGGRPGPWQPQLDAPARGAIGCLFRPDVVVVDLTAVTFVCSTFANFVAAVPAAVPGATLVLHNPSRMTRRVFALTGLDTLVTMPTRSGGPHVTASRVPEKGY
jgi:hypothetical protein